MAGLLVEHAYVRSDRRSAAASWRWFVLVAVAAGVLFGAMSCAAGLGAGAAHGAGHAVAIVDDDSAAHSEHSFAADERAVGRGLGDDDSSDASMGGGHPGMACVVSVDLRFPEMMSATALDPGVARPAEMATRCTADVDPPVPRSS